jgi:hypothetical protein
MADLQEAFNDGHEHGWEAALSLYGLHDCTVRNSGDQLIRVPLRDQVCYIELDPGEEISLRTVG